MRIRIICEADNNGIMDFNYQHQIQGLIYKSLSRSDPDYSAWLHDQGFVYGKDQKFKFFVFSGITFYGPIKPINSNGQKGFSFISGNFRPFIFSFEVASPVSRFIQHLVEGIFREENKIVLGRLDVCIKKVETLPDILKGGDEEKCLQLRPLESPIFVKKPMPKGERDIYLFPGDEGYEELLNKNLIHKYEALYGKPYTGEVLKFDFLESAVKSEKQFSIFKKRKDGGLLEMKIKGTLKPFKAAGPYELLYLGLECGFGQANSSGCGYVLEY